MPTLPQQVPHAKAATTLPEVIAPSDQLGREVFSFPSKQRLARQRLFSETCFECRCAKVSHKCAVPLPGVGVPQEQAAWDREKLLVQGWGAERGSSTGSGVILPFRGVGLSFTEPFCSPCSAIPALPLSVSWRGPLKHL